MQDFFHPQYIYKTDLVNIASILVFQRSTSVIQSENLWNLGSIFLSAVNMFIVLTFCLFDIGMCSFHLYPPPLILNALVYRKICRNLPWILPWKMGFTLTFPLNFLKPIHWCHPLADPKKPFKRHRMGVTTTAVPTAPTSSKLSTSLVNLQEAIGNHCFRSFNQWIGLRENLQV